MAKVDERVIGGLVVRIDRLLCVGFEDCVACAPLAFRMDDEGIACFAERAEAASADAVIEACRACPVDALTAIDPGGKQVAP